MTNIVVPVTHEAAGALRMDSEEVRVAGQVEDAVNRIGAHPGDLYAVWDYEGTITPGHGCLWAATTTPTYVLVTVADGQLLRLDDMYVYQVVATIPAG